MPSEIRLLRLLTWLSPAFPPGGYGWSQGLDAAIASGTVVDARTLTAWIAALLEHGPGWTDAVLAGAAWTAVTGEDHAALDAVAEFAEALAASPERRRETLAQGEAFLAAVAAWHPPPLLRAPYPVAVGAAAGAAGVPLQPALTAWLHAFASSLATVATRSIPLGQSDALAVLAALEPMILRSAHTAAGATLDDLQATVIHLGLTATRREKRSGV
jgi:urease accessory protein